MTLVLGCFLLEEGYKIMLNNKGQVTALNLQRQSRCDYQNKKGWGAVNCFDLKGSTKLLRMSQETRQMDNIEDIVQIELI